MKTEEMICELRRLEEVHKDDFVGTGETNWSLMCCDVANRMEELLAAQEPQWTPITFRPLTEEERAEHPDWCYIIDNPTPDDGDEILVSDGKNVWADVWCNDGEWCGLERGNELEGVAWMKMPTPWRKEANT